MLLINCFLIVFQVQVGWPANDDPSVMLANPRNLPSGQDSCDCCLNIAENFGSVGQNASTGFQ